MSTNEQFSDNSDHLSVRVRKYQNKLDDVLSKGNLVERLYLDRDLTREEFNKKMFEVGYQVAVRKLIQQVSEGDTKAMDLLFKRYDQHANSTRQPAKSEDALPSPSYKPRSSGTTDSG